MKKAFFVVDDFKKAPKSQPNPDFLPLCVINDEKAQKNGTKKTVYWVKKKPKKEDGLIKGEKWITSQNYVGDWKDNKKEGYGIIVYDNKDKYEGYWKNDMRNEKGTYWICIGKNKYRKLYTGEWFENKKDGQGIFFYKDGSCYDGQWKNNKREGKGLMTYANGEVYDGQWLDDLRHGYGILEKKEGDKYYGYWNKGKKEGQGYYYYASTGKIYLGEWHDDVPRCGIFTDVDDERIKKSFPKRFDAENNPPVIPDLKLNSPEIILEKSINSVYFLRHINVAKEKNISELFSNDKIRELMNYFSPKSGDVEIKHNKNKMPDSIISIEEFKSICYEKFGIFVEDETIELILHHFNDTIQKVKIDFDYFARLFYLMTKKLEIESEDFNRDEKNDHIEENMNEYIEENYMEDEMSGIEERRALENNKFRSETEEDYDI